jgi:hypothetical protein
MSGAAMTVEKDERGEDDGDEKTSRSSLRRFVGGSREEDAGAEKERERDGEEESSE